MRKPNVKAAPMESIPIPADVSAAINRAAKEMGIERKAAIIMALRRGIETIYGGVNNVPVKEWDAFQYEYKQPKRKRKSKIQLEADESY